jgi:hypothetical protein
MEVTSNETVTLRADEHSTLLLDIGEVKNNTKAIERLVTETRLGVIVTIILSVAAIVISIVH